MKCQICHKNEANIVFTQIVNNEKIVLQLCTECAKKKGLSIEINSFNPPPSPESFIKELIGGKGKNEENDIADPDLTCGVCGMTFAEFKKKGLFRCDGCHEAFNPHFENLLQQIHDTAVYKGKESKVPLKEVKVKHKLKRLKTQLNQCVEKEEYEKAAKLRDQISALEKRKTPR